MNEKYYYEIPSIYFENGKGMLLPLFFIALFTAGFPPDVSSFHHYNAFFETVVLYGGLLYILYKVFRRKSIKRGK